MISVRATFDSRPAQRAIRRLKTVLPQAVTRAHRGLDVRTPLVRAVAQDLGLPASTVSAKLTQHDTASSTTLRASAQRIPLVAFHAREARPHGVTAMIGGRARRYGQAFTAIGRRGRGVFRRTGKKRFPIVELHGPSVLHVARKQARGILARTLPQLARQIAAEFRQLLRAGVR